MAQQVLEGKVHRLESRMEAVEEAVFQGHGYSRGKSFRLGEWLNHLVRQEWSHLVGSFLFTVGFLGLILNWLNDQNFNVGLAVLFLIGGWLMLRNSYFVGVSDSTRSLLQEGYSQRRVTSQQAHRSLKAGKLPATQQQWFLQAIQAVLVVVGSATCTAMVAWLLGQTVTDPAWQTLVFLFFPFVALGYALYYKRQVLLALVMLVLYGVFIFNAAPLFVILTTYLTTVALAYYFYQHKMWNWVWVLTVVGYAVLLRWAVTPLTLEGYAPNTLSFALLSVAFLFFLFFNILFVYHRRTAADRQIVRSVLFTSVVGFILTSLAVSLANGVDTWLLVNLIVLILSVFFGYVAWILHGRYSYAKYYYLIAILAAFLAGVSQSDHLIVNLLWFAISVVLLGVGFVMNSYTARATGLLALIVALSHYFLYIVIPFSGSGIIADFVGLGVLHMLFLLILSRWYKELPKNAPESTYLQNISHTLYIVIVAIAFGMVSMLVASAWQTVAWILIGLLAWGAGRLRGYGLLQAVGVALTVVTVGKLCVTDSAVLPAEWHAVVLALFGLFLLCVGYLLWRFPRQVLQHFN